MLLTDHVNTFGRAMRERYGVHVHKVAIDAGFTCPNRDGTKGWGGCTFCNNRSFSGGDAQLAVEEQLERGREVIARRFRARHLLAYFQTYTSTYADPVELNRRYEKALIQPGVVGLSVGTRPDCVPTAVLDLLQCYQDQGFEVWLELGLQSAFDSTLARVNRGHGFTEYRRAAHAARRRGLQVCTHLIVGLPDEAETHALTTLERVLQEGVDGLKIHPLHVVRFTRLSSDWRHGYYEPWSMERYVDIAAELVRRTPPEVVFHRLTGTASEDLLLAPQWCSGKWRVLNAIGADLARHGGQGSALGRIGIRPDGGLSD